MTQSCPIEQSLLFIITLRANAFLLALYEQLLRFFCVQQHGASNVQRVTLTHARKLH